MVLRTLVTLFTCKSKEKFLIKQEKNGKSESCSKKEKFEKRPNLLTSSLKTPVFIGSLGTVGVSIHLTHTYHHTSEITEKHEPVCSKCYPGNMLDVTAYESFISENYLLQSLLLSFNSPIVRNKNQKWTSSLMSFMLS